MMKWAAGLALLGACTDPTDPTGPGTTTPATPDVADLTGFGDYAVGHQLIEIEYQPEGRDELRSFRVAVWYPAESGGSPATYAVSGVVDVPAPMATVAIPALGDEVWPVAAYSHGNGGVNIIGYPWGEHLASHGWVVVSPDHKGNRALDLLLGPADPFVQSAVDRPQDVSAALDWLEGSVDNPLEGRVDTSSVLMIGHSFGGYTGFAAAGANPDFDDLYAAACPDPENANCALLDDPDVAAAVDAGFLDPRISALVPQAPAISLFDPQSITDLELPTLLQTGRMDQTTTDETSAIPTWNALDGADDVWLEMEAGGHLTFLSICDDLDDMTIKTFQPSAFGDGCSDDFIPVSEALPVLRANILAWGNAHVLGDAAWLDAVQTSEVPSGFVRTLMSDEE